jgi:DNA-binding transcriptional regulator YdaS (Cro superfamily)
MSKIDVAEFLSNAIKSSGRTQAEIANECGFSYPNVVSMMKNGKTKIPLQRAPALARAIGIEPHELVARCLETYEPELYELLAEHASGTFVTRFELRLLKVIRAAAASGRFHLSAARRAAVPMAGAT